MLYSILVYSSHHHLLTSTQNSDITAQFDNGHRECVAGPNCDGWFWQRNKDGSCTWRVDRVVVVAVLIAVAVGVLLFVVVTLVLRKRAQRNKDHEEEDYQLLISP